MPFDITKPLELNKPDWREVVEVLPETETEYVVRVRDRYGDTFKLEFNKITRARIGHEADDNAPRIRNQSEEVANKLFRLWFGHKDWDKNDWRYLGDNRQYQFDNGKIASEACNALNAQSKSEGGEWKFMVKPHIEMSPNHNWREWMQERFETGEYTPCPWQDEEWYIKDHFCHASLNDPFRVAYIDNAMDGVTDKMTVLTAGRYLQKFYSTVLTPEKIASWVTKMDSEAELKFATTPEEIVHVYTSSSISSCMQYSVERFASKPHHPVSIYGAGDLELAYLERRGKIVARCLVRRSNMIWVRIYGDAERLAPRLTELGFRNGDGNAEGFHGARLLKIPVAGDVVMPYLDWDLKAKDNPDDPNTLLICGSSTGKYSGKSTNGFSTGLAPLICPECGQHFMQDNHSRYMSRTGRSVCPSCVTSLDLQRCNHCDNHDTPDRMLPWYAGDTGDAVTDRNGQQRYVCTHSCVGPSRTFLEYEGRAYPRSQCDYVSSRNNNRLPIFVIRQREAEKAAKEKTKAATEKEMAQ